MKTICYPILCVKAWCRGLRYEFNKVVKRYNGEKHAGSMSCWTQFCAMLYGQLSSRKSLREISLTWGSHRHKHYHIGASEAKRSTLSDANQNQPSGIYLEVFYKLLNQLREPGIQHKDAVRLIDSTTIDLCKQQFGWATFRTGKAGVKIHTVYDPKANVPTFFSITAASKDDKKAAENMPLLDGATYVFDRAYNDYAWYHAMSQRGIHFVGRMKSNAQFEVVEKLEPMGEGVLKDEVIRLSSAKAKSDYPINLRRTQFIRKEDNKQLSFITNDMKRSAKEIAGLYKQRWEIELFFKWIKQNLKIKRLVGQSENAVKTQIIIAMIAYLLLKLANKNSKSKTTLQQLAVLVAVNIMERRNISELLMRKKPPEPMKQNLNQMLMAWA
ncbi:MAG TPA: IS4 family transposase [Ghiorsea sp.]|nr:IS4 family transposase [Ghiorsea sp.]